MKILNIKKINNKYKIILENGLVITANDHTLVNSNILYKKSLTEKELETLKKEVSYYENYDKILKMINRKIRSEHEIKKELLKNEVSKEDIEKIINKLKNLNLINNEAFAIAYTNDKINLTNEGPYKIKQELKNQNIEEEYIEKALTNFTQKLIDNKLEKIINKRLVNNTKDTNYTFKQKTEIYLLNLGYSKEDIQNHLDNIHIDNSKLEKEMDKIYQKLKTKYEGYTLYNKLKQKLYSKGFTKEEIDNFIEKTSSLI